MNSATRPESSPLSASDSGGMVRMESRIGRPSKGDRVVLYSRPPRKLRESVEASAERAGFDSLSDYVVAILAVHEGLPDLAPPPARHPQQEALIARTA